VSDPEQITTLLGGWRTATETADVGELHMSWFGDVSKVAMPRLLAAVDIALSLHAESGGHCVTCRDPYGDPDEWPCEEYEDLAAALAGEPGD
jgi:hypothetical protein